jgi:hypothetical protein
MNPDLGDDLSARVKRAAQPDDAMVERVVTRVLSSSGDTSRKPRLRVVWAVGALAMSVVAGIWLTRPREPVGQTSARLVTPVPQSEQGTTSASMRVEPRQVVRIGGESGVSLIVTMPTGPTLAPAGAIVVIAEEESR